MKFTNLNRQLQSSAGNNVLPLEEILGMMTMLCDDVRFETGTLVEKCPVNNWELLIDRLYTISYTINYIYKKHAKVITEFDASSAEDAIWEKIATAETQCDTVRSQLKQMEGVKAQLQRAESALQTDLAAQKEKQKDEAACRQRISDLEQELEHLKMSSLPQLQKQCQSLESDIKDHQKQLSDNQTRYKALSADAERLKGQVSDAKDKLDTATAAVKALEAELETLTKDGSSAESLKEKLEQEKDRYSNSIAGLADCLQELENCRNDNKQLETSLEEARDNLDKARKKYSSLDKDLQVCRSDLNTLSTNYNSTNVLIETTKRLIRKKEEEHDNKKEELQKLDDKLRNITSSFDVLLNDIETRKTQLENMDPITIERDLQKDKDALEQKIQELDSLKRESESCKKQIEEDLIPKIQSARGDVTRLTEDKDNRLKELDSLQGAVSSLRSDLALLGSGDYQNRLSRSRTQLEILQQLHRSMTHSAQTLDCGWEVSLKEDLQNRVATAEHTIQELREAVVRYAQHWQAELDGEHITC